MKPQPPKIVSIRWWKDGEILEEGNELTILETEPGEGGRILLDLSKKIVFSQHFTGVCEYVIH